MAQENIEGVATDPSGSPLQDAVIALFLTNKQATDGEIKNVQYTRTDSNGKYVIKDHPDADGSSQEWHVAGYYEDGTGEFNGLSKPSVSASVGPAIPDSAVLYAEASDYDGSQWVSQVGPNIPDQNGNPETKTKTYRSQDTTVVEYSDGNSEWSQTTNLSLSNSKQAVIAVIAQKSVDSAGNNHAFFDGGAQDEFLALDAKTEWRMISGDIDIRADSTDTILNILLLERNGSDLDLFVNDMSNPLLSATGNLDDITGLTLNANASGRINGDNDIAMVEVLEDYSDSELSDETSRLKSEYNIS